MVIWFYSKTPEYGWLSNFSEHPFVLDGEHWPSVEHYYQAQKFAGAPAVVDVIRDAASPSLARKAGQDPSLTLRADWGSVKDDVMRQAVEAKFAQHVDLQGLLLATGDDELVHESDTDEYWGRLRSGAGDNRLGLILMRLRAELRGRFTEISRSLPEWVIFHVPHDSTHIPADVISQFVLSADDLQLEVTKMTDHSTLDLFGHGVPQQQILRAPVSRLVVDVERFDEDCLEPMATRGMGVVYERASDGRRLRHPFGPEVRQTLIDRWYRPHHNRLGELTCQALSRHGHVLLVDAHSFPSTPLPHELDQRNDRPQICIGTDEFHTPTVLAEAFVHAFRGAGFDVRLNTPYAGAMVPMRYFRQDERVCAVLVEVNRALYLDEGSGARGASYDTVARMIRQCIDRAISAWVERAALCRSDGATAVPAMSMLPFKNSP